MGKEFDVDAIVAGLDAEIDAAEKRADDAREKLEAERDEVGRLKRARRDLTGEPIQAPPARTGGKGRPKTGVGPNNNTYAPGEEITMPIIDFMGRNGGTTNQDLVDAGLAKNRQRGTDYLLRMYHFGMVKKGRFRPNPNPNASRPFQEYELP